MSQAIGYSAVPFGCVIASPPKADEAISAVRSEIATHPLGTRNDPLKAIEASGPNCEANLLLVEARGAEGALCPVDFKEIDKSEAVSFEYEGKPYSFCSNGCLVIFKKNPEGYGCPCPLEVCRAGGFDCAYFKGRDGRCQCYKKRQRK